VATEEDAVLWVAEVALGRDRYAIPIATLRAAVPLQSVTPVPLAPAHVIGVLRFQGKIVTAFSLAALLGTRGWAQDPAVLLVLEPAPDRLVAFDCEQIPKPIGLPLARVEEARARASGAVVPVTTADLQSVQLLDPLRLLEGAREGTRGR
jgi:purine-binding chemotaxis protein CheW